MGLTIDEIIRSLTAMKSVVGVNQFTINEAIDIMYKYQKIEQVLNVWREMGYNENDGLYMLISGVVEDGNVD